MACMLLLAACDNYLDIQPTGSVIPNSLAEYRALLARSYKDVSKFSDRGMACFRSDEMQVRDNEYDQNYYMDIERWNDLAPNAYTSSFEWAKYYNVLFIANHVIAVLRFRTFSKSVSNFSGTDLVSKAPSLV